MPLSSLENGSKREKKRRRVMKKTDPGDQYRIKTTREGLEGRVSQEVKVGVKDRITVAPCRVLFKVLDGKLKSH